MESRPLFCESVSAGKAAMRVGFNVRVLADPVLRGWSRYTIQLVRELATMGVELYLYSNRAISAEVCAQLESPVLHWRTTPGMGYLQWEQLYLPWRVAKDRLDVFHSPFHFGLPVLTGVPCVLTIHDAIEEVYYTRSSQLRTVSQRITAGLSRLARARADHILTVSEFSRQDLIHHLGMRPERISVSHCAADRQFESPVPPQQVTAVADRYRLPSKYLFYVGSLEERKNLPFVVRRLADSGLRDLHLVVGGGSPNECRALMAEAASARLGEQVHCVGRVPDADLPALYAGALAFVYPSVYEGFGLQLAEAMAVGCPVLAARSTCFPEVLGSGGELFSLSNHSELVGQLKRLDCDSAYRRGLSASARERSRAFSWPKTARQTLAVYQLVGKQDSSDLLTSRLQSARVPSAAGAPPAID